ncbi:DUF6538 domain-containing protein [Sphingomonas sp. FW199]|uniref:DUF6538 domain-containing protein n=1 Tax=Sphingomonas sp. FW199 TaxID=3400217 RepID=UPI003CF854AE
MCTYLAKRGSTYYFRRVIPVELRPAFDGRTEFMMSLRTKDREQAKRLIPARTIDTDRALAVATETLVQAVPMDPADRRESAADRLMRAMHEHNEVGNQIVADEIAEQEARQAAREEERQYWRRRMRFTTRELSPNEAAVKDLLSQKDFDLELARDRIASLTIALREAKAAGDPDALARSNKPSMSIAANEGQQQTGVMLDDTIVPRWAAERKVAAKTKDTHASVARRFYNKMGRMPVDKVTRRDVLSFKDRLIEDGQSIANINTIIGRLATLMQWAMDNELAASNPAKGIAMRDPDRARNKRREFDLASLNAIFASPVYASASRPTAGRGEAAYWMPLLALFTGARMEELGQLRPADITEISYPDMDGVQQTSWFIRITEDAEDNLKLKNAASERDVPLHPELVRLGFLAFVNQLKAQGSDRLFPRLRPDKYGRLTAKWGEWFGPYLREVVGVKDRRLVFHSFRHTFKQYARLSNIIEGVQRQIMGHSAGDVADEYGSGYPLFQVVTGMAQYRIPGLTLPAPWEAGQDRGG